MEKEVNKNTKILLIVIALVLVVALIVFLLFKFKERKENTDVTVPEIKEKSEITNLTLKFPITKDGNPSYVDKDYDTSNLPTELLEVLKNLKLDEEVIPEGIGFEGNYFIEVFEKDTKIEYVLTDHGKLCDLATKKCYTSDKDISKLFSDLNPENIISNIKLKLPTILDGEPSYVDKDYNTSNLPTELLEVLKNLKLDEEVIPEGIGFENNYFIEVKTEVSSREYVLSDHGKLCDLTTKSCYVSNKDIAKILSGLK